MSLTYMGRKIWTLDDFDFNGKTVLVRIDINSPISPDTGEILDDTRFKAHIPTIRELSESGARIVLLAHQGRPFTGDFVRLKRHAEILSRLLGSEVEYVPDVIGPEAKRAIAGLGRGGILLLDNTRLYSEDAIQASIEDQAKTILARELASLGDYYVNDAFAVSHRSQASVVGLPLLLPGAAGRLMEREVSVLSRALSRDERPKVFVLGGAKVKDTVKIISHLVEEDVADEILTTGLVALLFLYVSGVRIGSAENVLMKKVDSKTIESARNLIAREERIRVPLDFVVDLGDSTDIVDARSIVGAPKDIGPSTIEYYKYKMVKARIIVMRGPAGVIEDPRFRRGTRELVRAALTSRAFTIFGGGHFNSILSEFPETVRSRVGHISTGGGALLYFLSGRILPGLEALALSYEKFSAARGGGE